MLTRNRLVYVGRPAPKRKGLITDPVAVTVLSRPLPDGALRAGRDGIPVPDRAALSSVVTSLVQAAGVRIASASLVIPDDFVRVLAIDVEASEKNPKETEDVILWKFSRIFGEPALPLRMSWQNVGAGTEAVRLLAVATLEETASALEAAFGESSVRIGALESAALAVASLARKALPADSFLVWADGDAATTVFLKGGQLRFLRTKATSDPEEALQEIRLAASFVADGTDAEGVSLDVHGVCAAGPVGSPIVDRFRAFRAEHGGPAPTALTRATLAAHILTLPGLSGAAQTLAGVDDPAVLVALGAMAGGD
ncbi:MAG: hypothetical protein ABIQ65_06580 [Thermoanaerobaculia bacterium]